MNAIKLYRLSRWLYLHKFILGAKVFRAIIFYAYNCRIPYTCEIGKGTYLVAMGIGVALHDRVVIGKNCAIGHRVSIIGKSPYSKVPVLGDNVFIAPGAVISGPVIIENNVIIGANSVVTKSVKAGKIVAGVPARIIGEVQDLPYEIHARESFNDLVSPYL